MTLSGNYANKQHTVQKTTNHIGFAESATHKTVYIEIHGQFTKF